MTSRILVVLLLSLVAFSCALYDPATTAVQLLDEKQFQEKVVNGDEFWVVEFFAPWCGHCKQLAPHYEKVASNLKGIVNVAAVDCDKYPKVAEALGIKGFPTIRFIPAEKTLNPYTKQAQKMMMEHQGGRNVKDIIAAATKAMPSRVTIVNSTNSASFLQDDYPKALLFSQKSEVSSLYKSLSWRYRDRLRFGQAGDKEAELMKQFKVSSAKLPVLLVVPGNDVSKFIVHEGAINREDVPAFVDQHALKEPLPDPALPGQKRLLETLDASNFEELVKKDKKQPWLVLFEKNPSAFSKVFPSLATALHPAVRVGVLDASKHTAIAKSEGVTEYPTIRLYQIEKSDTEEYSASKDATIEAINLWLDDKLAAPIAKVLPGDPFNAFIQKCVDTPCIFLFTKETEPPLMFKLAAAAHSHKLGFGMLTNPPALVLQQFQIPATLPHIMVFFSQNGTLETLAGAHYSGYMNFADVNTFVSSFIDKDATSSSSSSKSTKAQPLVEITKDTPLDKACSASGLCAIAFLDGSAPAETLQAQIKTLDQTRENKAGSPYKFMWVDAVCQPEIAAAFDITPESCPTMVAVSAAKMRKRQLVGVFDTPTISAFLDGILSGKYATSPFSQLPPTSDGDCSALHEDYRKMIEGTASTEDSSANDDIMAEVLAAAKAREAEQRKLMKKAKSGDDDDEDNDDDSSKKKKKKKKKKKD